MGDDEQYLNLSLEYEIIPAMYKENTTYRATRHAKFLLCYHFIWCPKYRRGILDDPAVVKAARSAIEDAATSANSEVIAIEIMPDHVHLSLSALPASSPADLAARIKSRSGARIAALFPELKSRGKIWSRSYFCTTTGSVSTEVIRNYIETQWSRIK